MANGGGEASAAAVAPAVAAPNLRVVRCPKCGKYLPELEDIKVYRCGGCNATLQAKRSIHRNMVSSSEKSDGENVVTSEDVGTPSSKKEIPLNASPEADPGSNRGKPMENGEVFLGRSRKSIGSPSSRFGLDRNKAVFKDYDTTKHDYPSEESQTRHRESRYRRPSKAPVDNFNSNVDEMSKTYSPKDRENKQRRVQMLQQNPLSKGEGEEDSASGSRSVPRASSQGVQFTPYRDSGMSNGQQGSTYSRREHRKSDLPDRVKNVKDPARLLKTLDVIKDKLSQPYEVPATDRESDRAPRNKMSVPLNPYIPHGRWFPEGLSSINQASGHHFPLINENDLDTQSYHPKLHMQDDFVGYGESRPLGQTSYQTPNQYLRRPYKNYAYEQLVPSSAMRPHAHEPFYQQPTCSCQHCHNNHWQMPSHAPSSGFRNRNGSYGANTYGFNAVGDPAFPRSGSYNPAGINSSLLSQKPRYQQRTIPRDRCEPFAGGAPFIVCHNCFDLLQVPPTILSNGKDRKKLQCGSCFQVITFQVTGKQLVVSTPPLRTDAPSDPSNTINGIAGSSKSDVEVNCVLADSHSGNYGSSAYNARSADEKLPILTAPSNLTPNGMMEKEHYLDSSESGNTETEAELPRSPDTHADDEIPHATIYKGDVPKSSEPPKRFDINAYIPTLPSSEHYSPSSDQAVRSPEIVSTETNMQISGHTNLELPQGSIKISKEEEKLRKGGDSFFVGFIRKSIKARSNQPLGKEKFNVYINGHPIPDRLVKKAEKLAGSIQSGEYWYDYCAGFWGIMGEPCVGIIPPFIEEFNYPMPKKCAAGNTAVLVNGRELHHKDLQLLVDRGLPKASGRSYIIEMSGRVTDAISGEEFDGLGKLAPTIEKLKKGFGMRHP